MGVLGCPEAYRVELGWVERMTGGGQPLPAPVWHSGGVLDGVTRVKWERVLNDVAECEIEVGGRTGAMPCCPQLNRVVPYVWEARVWRDQDVVFEGPIVRDEQTSLREPFKLLARDPLVWFTENHLPNVKRRQPYSDRDPTDIAHELIEVNLFNIGGTLRYVLPPDSPMIFDYIVTRPVGETVDFQPDWYEPIIDILDDLADLGLTYTTVGRSILLGPLAEEDTTPPTARLTQDHFDGPFTVTQDGEELGTMGVGIVGDQDDDPPNAAVYRESAYPNGRVTNPYGPHIRIVKFRKGTSEKKARRGAKAAIRGRGTPPVVISQSGSNKLFPHAPIGVNDMVPGWTRVDVYTVTQQQDAGVCRPVRLAATFGEVRVEWVPGQERVQVGLIPIGTPTSAIPGNPDDS